MKFLKYSIILPVAMLLQSCGQGSQEKRSEVNAITSYSGDSVLQLREDGDGSFYFEYCGPTLGDNMSCQVLGSAWFRGKYRSSHFTRTELLQFSEYLDRRQESESLKGNVKSVRDARDGWAVAAGLAAISTFFVKGTWRLLGVGALAIAGKETYDKQRDLEEINQPATDLKAIRYEVDYRANQILTKRSLDRVRGALEREIGQFKLQSQESRR